MSFIIDNYGKITTAAFLGLFIYHHFSLVKKYNRLLAIKKHQDEKLSLNYQKLKKILDVKTKEHLCEVIFFNGRIEGCADHVIEKYDCPLPTCPATKIRKIVSYIDEANVSLDICLYLITNKVLGDAVMRAYQRGLTLRVIGDGDMAAASGSQIIRMFKKNIPIQLTGPPYIMHEKYLILDSSIVMEGSMNYTTQACSGNYEHVVVTGTPGIVQAFREHFNTLYEKLRSERRELVMESKRISDELADKWG